MEIFFIAFFIFLFGLCIGSFINVCIFRLPVSKSITKPARSVCPKCGSIIKFYDNIPVLSYIILKRRCRTCSAIIPFRYPMVEILSGFCALAVFCKFGFSLQWFIYYTFIASLIVITFIDLDHQIIPDVITLPGIPIFFVAALAIPAMGWLNSIIGILAGGGSLFAVAFIYNLLTRKDGMGGGDIKLLAMIGALIGLKGVLFTIFVSSAIGTLVGVLLMLRTKQGLKLAVPFGPFLAIGAVSYIFFGERLIFWYLGLTG